MPEPILHNYFRSTTSVRVRIALAMKGIDYEYRGISLLDGAHKSAAYLKLNPQGLVPALEIDGAVLTQSLAILEYLDETRPNPPLLPNDALGRVRVRALSHIIALDIHPVNNLRILKAIKTSKKNWFRKWAAAGFQALETRLQEPQTGRFCHGDTPGMADICLYAQMFNNVRFGMDMTPYPTAMRIHTECAKLAAFQTADPDHQPDAK